MKKLLLLLLACGPGWEPSEMRKFEVRAAQRHQSCICQITVCTNKAVAQCHEESEAFCLDAGYAKHCGNEEVEGSCWDC